MTKASCLLLCCSMWRQDANFSLSGCRKGWRVGRKWHVCDLCCSLHWWSALVGDETLWTPGEKHRPGNSPKPCKVFRRRGFPALDHSDSKKKKKKKDNIFFFFTYCSSFDLRAMVYIVPSCKFLTGVIISSSPSRFQMQTLPDAALGSSVRSQELD